MADLQITGSVGKEAKNNIADVKLIQALMNAYTRLNKGGQLEASISSFQTDFMKSVKPSAKVESGDDTLEALNACLDSVFKPVEISNPEYGLVTWGAEGAEGGFYHSRKFHIPTNRSGLTIGRGYDMKTKSADTIYSDLISAGVDSKQAEVIKRATGIFGRSAKQFVIDNDLLDFQITPDGQKKLFEITYAIEAAHVKRICSKADVIKAYGETDWESLDTSIKCIAIDLKFRGDYTPASRRRIQKYICANNFEMFKKDLDDRSKWSNVPRDRFKRRCEFLDYASKI